MSRIAIALLSCLIAFGCGDDGEGGSPDSGADVDAASGGENALGRACDDRRPCPSDPPHQCVYLQAGNPDVGYCSPLCETDADCLEGYPGELGGTAHCLVPGVPNACSVTCESAADCPGDTTCVSPGGPAMLCASQ